MLARRAGSYDHVTTIRMAPDQEPMMSEGEADLTSILDGRFLQEERTATYEGQPVRFLKLHGYNNATGRFEAIWTFNRSTAILMLTGESEDEGRTVRWSGGYDDPDRGHVPIDAVTRHVDADHFVLEVYGTGPDGERFTVQETSYRRKA